MKTGQLLLGWTIAFGKRDGVFVFTEDTLGTSDY